MTGGWPIKCTSEGASMLTLSALIMMLPAIKKRLIQGERPSNAADNSVLVSE